MPKQAEEGSPIKPSQAGRDERGRVNLDDLTDTDLDYGCDERGLAALRRRLKRAVNSYDGRMVFLYRRMQMLCIAVCNLTCQDRLLRQDLPFGMRGTCGLILFLPQHNEHCL